MPTVSLYRFAQSDPQRLMKGDREMKSKRWRYAIPLPTALLISYIIWLGRRWVSSGWFGEIFESGGFIAVGGLLTFPIGLPGVLWVPEDIMKLYFWVFVCGGYALYLTLTVVGMLKPTRGILLAFAVLLILNMAGCQMERTIEVVFRDIH